MIAFIDVDREAYGAEPIRRILSIAPSTYYAHVAQRVELTKRSARPQRNAALQREVRRVFERNFRVYGFGRSGGK